MSLMPLEGLFRVAEEVENWCSEGQPLSSKNLLLKGQRTTVPKGDPQMFIDGSFIKKALLCSVGLSSPKAGRTFWQVGGGLGLSLLMRLA